jgi:hypothetical protein
MRPVCAPLSAGGTCGNWMCPARLYFGDTRIRVEAENLHNSEVLKAGIDWKTTW